MVKGPLPAPMGLEYTDVSAMLTLSLIQSAASAFLDRTGSAGNRPLPYVIAAVSASLGLETSPGKPSQKKCSSLLGSFSFTLLPPRSPSSAPALMRVVECSGWCTSPTRCSNHTRSYDLSLSLLPEVRVWRKTAI